MPENVVSIFMLPFFACICGVGPLIFAGLLLYNARRGDRLMNNIKGAKNLPISSIQARYWAGTVIRGDYPYRQPTFPARPTSTIHAALTYRGVERKFI